MAEISKEKLARIVGHDEDAEYLKKQVRIIKDKKQFSVRIPIRFAELANIDEKKDIFEFVLVPHEEDGKYKFSIEADLKRGDSHAKGV